MGYDTAVDTEIYIIILHHASMLDANMVVPYYQDRHAANSTHDCYSVSGVIMRCAQHNGYAALDALGQGRRHQGRRRRMYT